MYVFSLGNYSAYSFYKAAWTVETLVAQLAEGGYTHAGLADMGGFYGGVAFSQACDKAGLRMVLGCRLLVRDFVAGWLQFTPRNAAGYAATCRLASQAVAGEVTMEDIGELQSRSAADIWISCPIRVEHSFRGRIGSYPRWRSGWQALLENEWDNLWLELCWHNEEERLLQRRVYSEWSRRGWDRWVIMSGARHAPGCEGSRLLQLLEAMGTLTRIGQAHPEKLPAGAYGLVSANDLKKRFERIPQVWRSTRAFADGCEFDYTYGRLHLPNPLINSKADSDGQLTGKARQEKLLAWRCLRGVVKRYGSCYPWKNKPDKEALLERLKRELSIVSETGYAGYFLVFSEVVNECGRRGIPLLARGSAAGSLICYALGVANVCPFRFGLRFERFLNRERMRYSKLPDIDLDLPWDRREEIMNWLYDRYGLEQVAMIGGFATFKGRASVAEVAKAMGVPAHEAHAWSKRIPHGPLRKFVRRKDNYVEARGAWEDDRFHEAVERAMGLHGLPRHPMMHPCGMVIADRPVTDFTPVGGSARGFSMTQMSMDPIEDLGLLKMDLLGQAGLSVIRDCLENLRNDKGTEAASAVYPDPLSPFDGLSYDDPHIYQMIQSGGARGVFHIESPAMTSLLKLCRCDDIDCLVATVSVIRPGAANEDKKTKFARRYLGLEKPEYVHPDLEDVLEDSYGLLIYEEHILLVSNRFAGMDFGTADLLRRILIKKTDDDAMDELEAVFRSCARRKGRTESEIDRVWHELRDFSGYMFNKAHGAAYAIEAYHGCWLKYHWPLHFLAAVLNNQRGFYRPLVYVMEILRQGGRFSLPDVQREATAYQVEKGHVHIPLWQIKGLGQRFRQTWEIERARGAFVSWQDFVLRTRPDPADAELLARSGALREFFDNRHEAIWRAGQVRRTRGSEHATMDLFEVADRVDGEAFTQMDPVAMAEQEAELLGFPVTLTPLELWMSNDDHLNTIPISDLSRFVGQEMRIAGIQVSHRLHRTTRGEMMKFVTFADETGMAETVLFPQAYKAYGWELSQKRAACVRVYIEWDETESGLCLTVTEVE